MEERKGCEKIGEVENKEILVCEKEFDLETREEYNKFIELNAKEFIKQFTLEIKKNTSDSFNYNKVYEWVASRWYNILENNFFNDLSELDCCKKILKLGINQESLRDIFEGQDKQSEKVIKLQAMQLLTDDINMIIQYLIGYYIECEGDIDIWNKIKNYKYFK